MNLLPRLVLALLAFVLCARASESSRLWTIGRSDNSGTDLALAPNDFANIKSDGMFVVGESNERKDWPYSHPGPLDRWAGDRSHTYVVLFGLKSLPSPEQVCALHFDLLDTHEQAPPRLAIEINGSRYEKALPRGGGDGSIHGNPERAREHRFSIDFPASLLRPGDNEVRITTLNGSWFIYDALWMDAPEGTRLGSIQSRTIVESVTGVRAVKEKNGHLWQPVQVILKHYGEATTGILRVNGTEALQVDIRSNRPEYEVLLPWAPTNRNVNVEVEIGGKVASRHQVRLKPAPKLTIYILPHSHTDIGYTEIQTAIEQKQVQNLLDGMAAARRTAHYPPGARFVWNVEVLWAADLFQKRLNEQQQQEFLAAVKSGQVALNGMYLNELTGLCRPEELIRLFRYSTRLETVTGTKIDSLMISDVPGYAWGTVTAMSQAGIRYFATAPNYFDRIGTILKQWENKPFYWVGPSGKDKVLVWIPFWGYAMSHRYRSMDARLVEEFCEGLEQRSYPYEIAHVRWSGHGDNATPDPSICEFVKDWNSKYLYPRFVIASTSEAFEAFEKRHGHELPHFSGDWTPYWEDGAGSSALQTGMNRHSSARLAQAETLTAMFNPSGYPAQEFDEAWKHVLLFSEHTWGAYCSVTEPERKETIEQWEIKKSYAEKADHQSRALMATALNSRPGGSLEGTVDVFNTASWDRSGLVRLPESCMEAQSVVDLKGKANPVQTLASGERVFRAEGVPPLSFSRYRMSSETAKSPRRPARASGNVLENGLVRVVIDDKNGSIKELFVSGVPANLADTSGGEGLNSYAYFIGDDIAKVQGSRVLSMTVVENGPLLAAIEIEAQAPGCRKLKQRIALAAGEDWLEVVNQVDKERLKAASYMAKEGKESLNFGFSFNVPAGEVLLDGPLGYFTPDREQLASACKNWLTVGSWAQIANRDYGVTWVTLDAPLIQLGGLTARFLNSQYDPESWRKEIGPTQKLYSWAMNNHWGTNYRAYQEGLTRFAYAIRAHRKSSPAEATRFAAHFEQPLMASAARGPESRGKAGLRLSSKEVVCLSLKPSDDGRAWIIRLFNASPEKQSTTLHWGSMRPKAVYVTNTGEKPLEPAPRVVSIPGRGLLSLRAEW